MVGGVAGWIFHRAFLRTIELLCVYRGADEESLALLAGEAAGSFPVAVTADFDVLMHRRCAAWSARRDRRKSAGTGGVLHPAGIRSGHAAPGRHHAAIGGRQ